jgi:transcriptional regulator with XRE-family HTH domain
MRRRQRHVAPEGFINLLRGAMERRGISLNQLANRAGVSPAFLSRILNRERGLPSDKIILCLAELVDLQPPQRLLIEAGRIPEELKTTLTRTQIPELLRATGKLSETELQELLNTAEALALKQHQSRKRA